MLTIYSEEAPRELVEFCERFVQCKDIPRFILGRNEYAKSIAGIVDISGYIDDFTDEKTFLGKPIVKVEDVPANSMVVSTSTLKPISALNRLKSFNLECIDYFSFRKYAGIDVQNIGFWDRFEVDLKENWEKYQYIYDLLQDDRSKDIFSNIINFRISGNLNFMKDFAYAIEEQYFEEFLFYKSSGEVFADVGCYDGKTSLEFIKRCPYYKSIHAFEPDMTNLNNARRNLRGQSNIFFYQTGLAECKKTLKFDSTCSSASKINENGNSEIEVDMLDSIVKEPISFIKMDIEGAEKEAILGAQYHIKNDYPKLAICVYHRFDDLWKIPAQVFKIRKDYSLFLRHYTEGIDETVMFFIPKVTTQVLK